MTMKFAVLTLPLLALAALPALAEWQTASVGVGNNISNVAVDPVRNRIFTANNSSGTVSVVDGRTNAVQTWTAGSQPKCLVVNPISGKLYVSITGSATNDTVVVFDTLGAIVNKLPVKSTPNSMVIDADSNRLFVSNNESDTVSVFKDDIFEWDIAVKNAPRNMAFNPVNRMVYLTYDNDDSVACINADAPDVIHCYSGDRARGIAVNASVNKAYIANEYEDSLTILDCTNNTIFQKIPVGDSPVSVVCDPSAKRAYVANYASGTITAVNCSTNASYSTVAVKSVPYQMAVNPVTRQLYVSYNYNNSWLMIVDGVNIGAKDSLYLGHTMGPVAVNPVTNKIYVAMETGTVDSLAVVDGSDFGVTTVQAKNNPTTATVNPVTGDVYFANNGSDNVTVLRAYSDTLTIAVGDAPVATAVNTLTNKVFVCNYGSRSVTVIDGASYTVERTILVDSLPRAVAVNPITNYIYVGHNRSNGNRITVIDGKDWDTTSVEAGLQPMAVAVNPATNRIYTANFTGGTVSVIDGAHQALIATIPAGSVPYAIEANPATNKIYCANMGSDNVTVIDGAANTGANVTVGDGPMYLAVNRANDKVYVSNNYAATVSEIDGYTNAVTTIPVNNVSLDTRGIAADPLTGKVFVCNSGANRVTIIDCASRDTMSVAVGTYPYAVAVSPVVNPYGRSVYVANRSASGTITTISQMMEQYTGVITFDILISPWERMIPAGTQDRPGWSMNYWTPYTTGIGHAAFSLASSQSYWKLAQYSSSNSSSLYWHTGNDWGADTAIFGENIYRRFSLEAQGASTNNLGVGTPFAGNVNSSMLYRIDYAIPNIAWWDSLPDDNDSTGGYGPYTVKAVITDFSGVDSASLGYSLPGKGDYTTITMTRALADTFVAEIPEQSIPAGISVEISYLIFAWDHANSANNSSNNTSSDHRHFWLRNLTGVAGNPTEPALPRSFALQPCRPNPARGVADIHYQLPKASLVTLEIYSITGQLVQRFDEGTKQPGYYTVKWNAAGHGAGVYFYRLRAGEYQSTKKLVVIN